MLRSIQKLIGDKRKQLVFPIFLMSLDAIGSLVMYLMLYFTVIHQTKSAWRRFIRIQSGPRLTRSRRCFLRTESASIRPHG